MCRFLVYIGKEPVLLADLLTRPSHSIIQQSWDSRERMTAGPLNGDGFGVGWYAAFDPTPCIFTSINPAWNNLNLRRLADKVMSRLIFAHVRAASLGLLINEANCHPFSFGPFIWMHNGQIVGFTSIKRKLVQYIDDQLFNHIQGTTDSEYSFMLFLQILFYGGKCRSDGSHASSVVDLEQILKAADDGDTTSSAEGETAKRFTADEMRQAMTKTVRLIAKWTSKTCTRAERERSGYSLLNYAVSDGFTAVVTRFTDDPIGPPASLYYTSGTRYQAKKKGEYHLVQERRQECFIIASEPLSVSEDDRRDWVPVPKNHCVVVTSQHNLLLYPINLAAPVKEPIGPSSDHQRLEPLNNQPGCQTVA